MDEPTRFLSRWFARSLAHCFAIFESESESESVIIYAVLECISSLGVSHDSRTDLSILQLREIVRSRVICSVYLNLYTK